MYIAYNIYTKRVVGKPSTIPFTFLSNNVAVAECDNIPQSYDYLMVDNLQNHTRVTKEAYIEETSFIDDNGNEVVQTIEHQEELETYYTCDLIAKFYEYTPEQIEKQKEKRYHDLTERYIRQKYSQGDMEAIINNYLEYKDNYQNENALIEYEKMQAYRKECKTKAHKEVYGV